MRKLIVREIATAAFKNNAELSDNSLYTLNKPNGIKHVADEIMASQAKRNKNDKVRLYNLLLSRTSKT